MVNLDVFRGICAFTVFVYHLYAHVAYDKFMVEDSGEFRAYMAGWYVLQTLSTYAVLAFFVLSGLVISIYVQRDIAPSGRYAEFLIFRFTRLSFVCAPVTLVSVLLALFFQSEYPAFLPWDRYQNYSFWLVLGSATGFAQEWNWPGWTLKVEWAFYLLVAFVGAIASAQLRNLLIACLCGAALLGVMSATETLIAPFFMGAGLYFVLQRGHIDWRVSGGAGAAVLMTQLFFPSMMAGYNHAVFKSVPLVLLVLSFASMPEMTGALMRSLHYLGRISFSLYCWHWPVILFGNFAMFGRPNMASYTQVAVGVVVHTVVVIAVSHVSYRLFERTYKLRSVRQMLWSVPDRA